MADYTYELIIIGGGPAGLTAGLYAARDGLNFLLFEKGTAGGQMLLSTEIDNYPGFSESIIGIELAQKMRSHGERFGMSVRSEEAKGLAVRDGAIYVATDKGEYGSKSVIVATGSSYRKLGVPGEESLLGRGVSYCGSCDGPFFRGRSLVVVGGGDSAIEEALFLTRFASGIKVVHRRNRLRAGPFLKKQASANEKIEFVWDSVVTEILGEEKVRGVVLENVHDGSRSELECDGVFIFIGAKPSTDFLRGVVELDETGYVVTDINMRASLPGVFAAGDVRRDSVKQIAVSVGDGVTALIHAERYIEVLD